MWALERGAVGIALVVDEANRLVGTLTDGDVRRALLKGASRESELAPHVCTNITAVGSRAGRAEVLDLMQARRIEQIPIVDEEGRLLGLHLLHEVLGNIERPNWAVIMAGGQGTRLWPLTENLPKPMIRVAGRPILERLVLQLVGFGITRIFVSIHYLGDLIEQHFGDGSRFGCRMEYLREDRPLGTGGSLSLLPEVPQHPLIVMNGDLVTQADLGSMLAFHERAGQRATIGVRRYYHTIPFGCVELDGSRVTQFDEKPRLTRLINTGIYVLDPQVVARVPRGQEFALPSLLEDCLGRGEPVGAFEIEDDWIDIGQREHLTRARGGEGRDGRH